MSGLEVESILERLELGVSEDSGIMGALKIRTGFWGILYYGHNKEPP